VSVQYAADHPATQLKELCAAQKRPAPLSIQLSSQHPAACHLQASSPLSLPATRAGRGRCSPPGTPRAQPTRQRTRCSSPSRRRCGGFLACCSRCTPALQVRCACSQCSHAQAVSAAAAAACCGRACRACSFLGSAPPCQPLPAAAALLPFTMPLWRALPLPRRRPEAAPRPARGHL
jgi:hypothetical protein